jgi:enamine deaminase RidA (YjgF/YER057c/UK114 family)
MTMKALQPDGWQSPRGYANGVVTRGQLVVLAGQIGWNPTTAAFETDDFAGQCRQALMNVLVLLKEAGATPAHLVRLTWYITDRAAYLGAQKELGNAYRELFGKHYPAMSVVVVAGLIEARAQVEIEASAVIPE